MICRTLAMLWASPGSLVGLTAGGLALCTGGRCRRVGHTLEFHGGFITWMLRRLPVEAIAMTLGHVIIGRTTAALDLAREHEWVHVRQFERWGPLFIPAYLTCSLWLWLRGREAYRENPFECEAYTHDRLCALGEIDRKAPDDIV